MAEDNVGKRLWETAPGALLIGPEALMKDAGKTMLKDAPKVGRFVMRRIPEGPGFVYDIADIATAKDKPRAVLGVAGGALGGVLGEAVGGPLGAMAGYSAGEAGTKWLYDHHDELAQKAADTARWIRNRTAHVVDRFGHGFDQGMPPHSQPLR